MDCSSARPEIPALVQGELADNAQREIEDHLRACPACSAEERAVRDLLDALRDAADAAPSPAVWEAIRRGTGAPADAPRPEARPPRPLFFRSAAAAATVLVFGAFFLFRPPPGSRPVPVAAVTASAGADVTIDDAPVARPDTLAAAGQALRVRGAGGAVLVTPSNDRLVAGPGTEMRFTSPRDLVLARGALLIESGTSPPLVVTTPAARVLPLGTRYLVTHDTKTRVFVEEGIVRLSGSGKDLDVPAGSAARTEAGSPPAPDVVKDIADLLRRHADAAAPSGLRLEARLAPPNAVGIASTRWRLTVRLLKDPGTGPPEARVSTIGGGLSYLTGAGEDKGSPGAPAPVIPLDPAGQWVERGEIRQGMARITPAVPYEIAGEVDLAGLLPRAGSPARLVVTWVGRRPPGDPRAWAGALASDPISVPGGTGEK